MRPFRNTVVHSTILLVLVGLSCSTYTKSTYKPKTTESLKSTAAAIVEQVGCYQCEYRPPHTRIEEFQVPVQVQERVPRWVNDPDCYSSPWRTCKSRLVYDVKVNTVWEKRNQTVMSSGGFPACSGPIDDAAAPTQGLHVGACEGNCYVRKDDSGNIQRGCYSGEYGVNPDLLGCNKQAGVTYCFCQGDKCNGGNNES